MNFIGQNKPTTPIACHNLSLSLSEGEVAGLYTISLAQHDLCGLTVTKHFLILIIYIPMKYFIVQP